jgi:hypothetical protein
MKTPITYFLKLTLALSLALSPCALRAAGASPGNPTAAPANTNLVAALPPVEIPQSVFVISANPKLARNPFFPQAAPTLPPTVPNASGPDFQSLVLNGITSPPKRTAMINGYTFEPGEEHEVRTTGGAKTLVKCEDIRPDSAVILVAGVRRELKLRNGL